MTLLIIYLISAGWFLVVFLICAKTIRGNKLMQVKMWRVFGVAFTPVINLIFASCTTLFLLITFFENSYNFFKFCKEEFKLVLFSWKVRKELKKDEWFREMSDKMKKN